MNTHPIPPGYAHFYGQPAMQNLAQGAYGSAAAIPPGYTYFYGQPAMQNLAYGSAAGMYNPAAAAMSVPSTSATQFQQKAAGAEGGGGDDIVFLVRVAKLMEELTIDMTIDRPFS